MKADAGLESQDAGGWMTDQTGRRQWLVAAGRWALLTALAGLSSLPLLRRGAQVRRCPPASCPDCAALVGCQLPAAIQWRRQR